MKCKHNPCDKPQVAKELCKTHYYSWRRSPEAVSIYGVCHLDGCIRPKYARQMCSVHNKRVSRGYNPLTQTIFDDRPAKIEGNIAKIPLGVNAKDGYAIVDKDFAWVDKYRWHADIDGYPANKTKGKLHYLIFRHSSGDIPTGKLLDHIDRDRKNSMLSNLRIASKKQNLRNRGKSKLNTSGYKGVYRNLNKKRWVAIIIADGLQHYLGTHDTKEQAAIAYNEKAKELFGEFAYLNKV